MSWLYESAPDDYIRLNGKGRLYLQNIGQPLPGRFVGEIDGLTFNVATTKDIIYSNSYAAGAAIVTRQKTVDGTLTFGLREQSVENYQLALLGSSISSANQAAGNIVAQDQSVVSGEFRELGYIDPYIIRLDHDTIGGGGDTAWALGEVVTGGDSGATGTIRWIGSGFILLTNTSYPTTEFDDGETITTPDTDSAVLTGVAKQKDIILGDDATPSSKYDNGVEYDTDTMGYVRRLAAGPPDTSKVWFQYDGFDVKTMWGMASGTVSKQLVFVSDIDEGGPHMRWTFKKVDIEMGGDLTLVGEGESAIPITSTVIADTTQPIGQQYFKEESFKAA